MKKSSNQKICMAASLLLLLTLACNAPFLNPAKVIKGSLQKTAEAMGLPTGLPVDPEQLASMIPNLQLPEGGAQTAIVDQFGNAATLVAQMAGQTTPSPDVLETPSPESPEGTPVADQSTTPGEPGKGVITLFDANSSKTGDKKYTSAGENYIGGLFERPFTADKMDYRGDLDIQKAEIFSDPGFYTVTIFLNTYDPQKSAGLMFGVEIDNDIDGRGDFLVWVQSPKANQWSTDGVKVLTDNDGDVGGKTVLQSDAPSNGNGYDLTLFPAAKADPGTAWSRIAPNNPTAIQIAFKPDVIGKVKSFMWGAWADGGLKNPAMFDYNDVFTLESAGSPLEKNKDYPLKKLFLVDNTCRGLFGRAATGAEPGLCADLSTLIKTLPVPTSSIFQITPAIPLLP
jgi:hypothetical protein